MVELPTSDLALKKLVKSPKLNDSGGIRVVPYDAEKHAALWDSFIDRSMNGTVFQKQQFLLYHPDGRFQFHHLLFFSGERLVAVLPGGFRDDLVFESPLGASYGSFVTEDISTQIALDIVEAFENYIREIGIKDVYLTAAPVVYQPVIIQTQNFALLYRGFEFQRHYISHVIDLRKSGVPFDHFQSTARKHIRRVSRMPEVRIEESNRETIRDMLAEFYPILIKNKAKYNAKPTHTLDELLRIEELIPDMMKLFLVRVGDKPIAGSLLFIANRNVALVFYHMLLYEFDHLKPIYLLMDRVTRWSKEAGYRYVDIGVSQDTSDENPMTPALSLIHFKEKFDSRGVLRSTLHKHYD